MVVTCLHKPGVFKQCSVDVELCHIVDNNGASHALGVAQQVAQQRGLASSKEPADERHWELGTARCF